MKILIAGATGMIGSALSSFLQAKGHLVKTLTRKAPKNKNEFFWDPERGEAAIPEDEEVDAVINLAGESIADGRWSAEKKKRILLSRVLSVKTLCSAIGKLKRAPHVYINASAIGYYGPQSEQGCTEQSPRGESFLAEVCEKWEAAAEPLKSAGIRVVLLRIGMVLSGRGGALGKLVPLFKIGLGGVVGSGRQVMSWISIDDLVSVFLFAIQTPSLQGAVNAVTPNAVTNREFTKTLGKVLNRPTIFPVPAWIIKLLLGEMGEELILSSCRALPEKLQQAGFSFQYPALEEALKKLDRYEVDRV